MRGALWWLRQLRKSSTFAIRQAAARRCKLHFPRYRLVKVSWKSVQPFPRTKKQQKTSVKHIRIRLIGGCVNEWMIINQSMHNVLHTAPAFDASDTCTVESIDADSATVRWPAPSSAQFYYIDIATDASLNSTSNVYNITGLSPVTNYTFIITVYGKGGTEGNSVECRGRTGLYITFSIGLQLFISTAVRRSWFFLTYEQILQICFTSTRSYCAQSCVLVS